MHDSDEQRLQSLASDHTLQAMLQFATLQILVTRGVLTQQDARGAIQFALDQAPEDAHLRPLFQDMMAKLQA